VRAVSIVYRRDSFEAEMTIAFKRAGLIAVGSALIVAAACGNEEAMDESLKRDLASVAGNGVELAPRTQSSQLVISPVEAAPASAPAAGKTKVAPKAPSRTPVRVASTAPVREQSAPAPVQTVERPTIASPAAATEPPPLPPMTRRPTERQSGTYKTEAEIFRQMPWIKP